MGKDKIAIFFKDVEVSKEKNEDGLTVRQQSFLDAYDSVLDVYKAATMAGISKTNIMADLRRNTPFAIEFRKRADLIEDDPRFSKSGSMGNLLDLKRKIKNDGELKSAEKYRLLLDIQKEINKMMEGNLASKKTVSTNTEVKLEAVYDFTKPIEEPDTIDIDYEDTTD